MGFLRKSGLRRRIIGRCAAAAVALLVAVAPAVASRFTPPQEDLPDPGSLRSIVYNAGKNPTDAAVQLDALVQQHVDALTNFEGGLLSVAGWLDAMQKSDRERMAAEYEKRFGADAKNLLLAAVSRRDCTPEDLYAVARRYPLTRAAGEACFLAAGRATELGDADAAAVFFAMAVDRGFRGNDAGPRADVVARAIAEASSRAVVFEAPWYQNAPAFTASRVVPVSAGELTIVAGKRFVLAMRDDATVAWSWSPKEPSGNRKRVTMPWTTGRGATFAPAVLIDSGGSAAIVFVHQPDPQNDRGRLRALAGTDGRLLWSTDAIDGLKDANFLGSPTVVGRCVFATAIDRGQGGFAFDLVALNATTGKVIWKSQIGTIKEVADARKQSRSPELEDFWQQCRPAVMGDKVIVTPNAGCVIAVGRFDGKVRWTQNYPLPKSEARELRVFLQNRANNPNVAPPLAKVPMLRASNTPVVIGRHVVVAPQDSAAVYGFDLQTGRRAWENRDVASPTLVGESGGRAIFSGDAVTAVDPVGGRIVWNFYPAGGAKITGPAVTSEKRIDVPTSGGIVTLSPADGKPTGGGGRIVDFSKIREAQAGKAALAGAEVADAFGPRP